MKVFNDLYYSNDAGLLAHHDQLQFSSQINPHPQPPPPQQWGFGGDLVAAFCHRIVSQPYWKFFGFFILTNYTWKIVYYFIQWNPQILPFYTM